MLTRAAVVRLSIVFTASSGRAAQELLDVLRFLEPATRLESGCLQCCNWIDTDPTVHHMEDWASEADLRHRVRSEDFTPLLEMVEAAQEARVQFDFVAATRGLDYVAEVRGQFSA